MCVQLKNQTPKNLSFGNLNQLMICIFLRIYLFFATVLIVYKRSKEEAPEDILNQMKAF